MWSLPSINFVVWLALSPNLPPCPDVDLDGVCTLQDQCWGDDATGDADFDRVCDDRDLCLGDDHTGDRDADLICDDADFCLGDNFTGDADDDGRCGDRDVCWGDDRTGDRDGDGTCDDLDQCAGDDLAGDSDGDGLCDDRDLCVGADALLDHDGDGVCDNLDLCEGDDRTDDLDGDGFCGDVDLCLGDDLTLDDDGDGTCGDLDPCLGRDASGDADGDGVCNEVDPCDDTYPTALTDCVVPDPLPVNVCGGSPIWFQGRNTGFVTCPDGSVNRVWAASGWLRPETDPELHAPMGYGSNQCTTDAECDDHPHGACAGFPTGYGPRQGECAYGCDSDADCGVNQACLPPTVGWYHVGEYDRTYVSGSATRGRGLCVTAYCGSADDCGSGECAYTWNHTDCGDIGAPVLTCRTPSSTCRDNSDCPTLNYELGTCSAGATRLFCENRNTTCGRPLLDGGGGLRVAGVAARSDWSEGVAPSVGGLDEATREALAAHWLRVAALEHASVASFARHTLELLSLGAPASLLSAVGAAQADEVAHARSAFKLASVYAGRELGPATLAVSGTPLRVGVEAIARALFEEGCVGETVAAAEAGVCAERAVDPAVAGVLCTIAGDEAQHAGLAWRTLAWLVGEHPALVPVLRALLIEAAVGREVERSAHPLARHGLLSEGELEQLRQRVVRSIVAPAVEALVRRAQVAPRVVTVVEHAGRTA